MALDKYCTAESALTITKYHSPATISSGTVSKVRV